MLQMEIQDVTEKSETPKDIEFEPVPGTFEQTESQRMTQQQRVKQIVVWSRHVQTF